ncbi:MAG: C25 family cysteine peptidase [Roseiflexaceae bacterium]|nr:C25 family cysteine peptidase [Roseiflexaceae bacterium]
MMTRFALVLALVISGVGGAAASVSAIDRSGETLLVQATGSGTRIFWRPTALDPSLPVEPVLIALRVVGDTGIEPRLLALDDAPWGGISDDLPGAPIFVLREAQQRGERLAVLALGPVYVRDGQARVVRTLEALVEGAVPLHEFSIPSAASSLAATTPGSGRPPAFPSSPALRVQVDRAGIQVIPVGALNAAMIGAPERIKVSRAGVEVPIELRDASSNGVWGDPGDELRFYAPPPGNRWNRSDTYWITLEEGARLRISSRVTDAPSGEAPSTALERGVVRGTTYYDSRRPGSDGDHWFAKLLRAEAGQPADDQAVMTVPLTTTLPATTGTVTLMVSVHTQSGGARRLAASVESSSGPPVEWNSSGDTTLTLSVTESSAAATQARLTLTAGVGYVQVAIDTVEWLRPIQLQFGGQGATFQGAPDQRAYRLAGAPAGFDIYDITNPMAPVRLLLPSEFAFEDSLPGRSYLLTGAGTRHTPTVKTFTPPALPTGDVLYIAPSMLHAALTPLVDLRRAQGYAVAVVDVQHIYDGWSYGQVDPAAIRAFLQFARPRAVTLVGDGSSDPFDYTDRGAKNVNLIPPYLATVDPWLGETACETCYAQLDGDQPTDDRLPDVWLGRLPVKSAAELRMLVAKIIGYETALPGGAWRSRMIYLADDADSGGDFAAQAAASIALQPAGVQINRVFFGNGSGQIPNATAARTETLARFNNGAAVVAYFGHAHQQQWAVTELSAPENWLLHRNDVPLLTNGARLPVVLALTCLSSAFQWPSYVGMTLDEALLLHERGGAVAVWGPTGLGVSYGHDKLQQGFFRALWSPAPEGGIERAVPLGALTSAGFRELFTSSACCQETIFTYALLGDPLTPLRVTAGTRVALPLVQR